MRGGQIEVLPAELTDADGLRLLLIRDGRVLPQAITSEEGLAPQLPDTARHSLCAIFLPVEDNVPSRCGFSGDGGGLVGDFGGRFIGSRRCRGLESLFQFALTEAGTAFRLGQTATNGERCAVTVASRHCQLGLLIGEE